MARQETLTEYRRKRNFSQTPEPEGKSRTAARGHTYVIQKHAARRLHFDFRLEHKGVLMSWAVTKGPSLDPAVKRLAVRTEDHPIDYASFEGVIPSGYGAGTVLLWDTGRWTPKGNVDDAMHDGVLKFNLQGQRLKGNWALVRMKPKKKNDKENWLLVKERDQYATPDTDPVKKWTDSVISGRGLKEVKNKVSPRTGAALPTFVPPQLAQLADTPPEGDEWLHEVKYDGYRIQVLAAGPTVALITRNGKDWTARYPDIADAFAHLKARSAVIDGELVALDAEGHSSFSLLRDKTDGRLFYYAFDLLELDGQSLLGKPLHERKAKLQKLMRGLKGPVRFSDGIRGNGAKVVENACRMRLEGIVSKRRDDPYRSGYQRSWVKSKCIGRDEFVIGGYRRSDKRGRPFASLLVGEYSGDQLVYRGRVGTGFSEQDMADLAKRMTPLRRKTSPFAELPADARRDAVWMQPRLVAEIAYPEKTAAGLLRQPAFLGLREDKAARDVRQRGRARSARGSAASADEQAEIGGVLITHAGRVVFPEAGLTKADVARWYDRAAENILPYLQGRPVSLVRCPDGLSGDCFFQKHAGQLPDGISTVPIREKSGANADYIVINQRKALLLAAQMGMIELHGWGARADLIERPDRMIFDLDPDPKLPFPAVKRAAEEVRDLLQQAGLKSFPLLTGGKGIHVVVPLDRRQSWDDVADVSRTIARSLAAAAPDRYVATATLEKRRGRIFIDWLRNRRGATAVVPYSLRARPGASVAVPVRWTELDGFESAAAFDIPLAARRLSKDAWPEAKGLRQSLTQSLISALNNL